MLRTEWSEPVREAIEGSGVDLHVPSLCDVELSAAFRNALLDGSLSESRAAIGLDHYLGIRITRHGHQALMSRILQLRNNFSAYDACYVALAERLDAPLLTADRRLARATAAHTDVSVLSVT